MPAIILAQPHSPPSETGTISSRRDANAQIVSLITSRQQIGPEQLQLLKIRLQMFATILEQKLLSASPGTKMLFSPVRQAVQDVLSGTGTALSPDDNLYRTVETIMAKIVEDPVLAMAYEEALRLPNQNVLASIQPEKGHGAAYGKNESIHFQVTAVRDCYAQVLFLAPESVQQLDKLRPVLIYPEEGQGSARMSAGQTLLLGEKGEFTVQPPYGNDLVIVIASTVELQSDSSMGNKSYTTPLHFDMILADIYGRNVADKLSVNSSFFVSKSAESAARGTEMALLTEDEAEALRLNEQEWDRPPVMYRSIQAGPVIRVHEPELTDLENPTIETVTPMNLKITFEKKAAPVDMGSLEVTAKKGFLSMSITERVKEHINGTLLDARNIDFPSGKFRIQVEIADVEGIVTSQEYRLEVK